MVDPSWARRVSARSTSVRRPVGAAATRRYESYIVGLWVGDPAFLREAQLSDFQLFISPSEDGCRQGYLIITDEHGEFVSNQGVGWSVEYRPDALAATLRRLANNPREITGRRDRVLQVRGEHTWAHRAHEVALALAGKTGSAVSR